MRGRYLWARLISRRRPKIYGDERGINTVCRLSYSQPQFLPDETHLRPMTGDQVSGNVVNMARGIKS